MKFLTSKCIWTRSIATECSAVALVEGTRYFVDVYTFFLFWHTSAARILNWKDEYRAVVDMYYAYIWMCGPSFRSRVDELEMILRRLNEMRVRWFWLSWRCLGACIFSLHNRAIKQNDSWIHRDVGHTFARYGGTYLVMIGDPWFMIWPLRFAID